MRPANCHPSEKYYALGLCRQCYYTEKRKGMVTSKPYGVFPPSLYQGRDCKYLLPSSEDLTELGRII